MISQCKRIRETKWDVLIVLDSCRYDIFKKVYREIFNNGKLEMILSDHVATDTWLMDAFSGWDCNDMVYMCPIFSLKKWVRNWTEQKYIFHHVEEVWDSNWDLNTGTVLAKDMTKESLRLMEKYKDKRFFIHYMQPHWPYLYYGGNVSRIGLKPMAPRKTSLKRKLAYKAEKVSQEMFWRVAGRLGLLPKWDIGYLWYTKGREGILKGYTEDLKGAMKYVKQIMDKYPEKKFVITADHGEELGDSRRKMYRYGPDGGRPKTQKVAEVPWYVRDGSST